MIKEIISNFRIYGDFIEAMPFGNGHINDTFLVVFNQAGIKVKYILRKINKYVFKNPEIVVSNTVNVINHITEKLSAEGDIAISNHVMKLVESNNNDFHYVDKNKDYWCTVLFIDNAYTVEFVETKEQAYQAAKAFGKFQRYLIDADVETYKYSIPNFHNLENRLVAFNDAVKKNLNGRVAKAINEIEISNSFRYLYKEITELLKNNKLPVRITHNDTKINNVMLNKTTNEGECVIDLDTVMPGTVLFDFGDMVRTYTSPVEEDEKNVSKVKMRIEIFEGLARGYIEELKSFLENVEIKNLVYGAMVITYEQIIRFLTDYLNGDIYYCTKYDDHNLIRTKNQIALLESIIKQKNKMEQIVNNLLT